MKNVDVFHNWEEEDEPIIKGKCTPEEAFNIARELYPEVMEKYDLSSVHPVIMYKCLDCESYWIDGDGVCGECGEQRLSRRPISGYHIF